MTTISVEYPKVQEIVVKTAAELKAMGYKNRSAIVRHEPVNRAHTIVVKQVKRLVQEEFMSSDDYEAELETKCVSQTGLSRSEYQLRFKRAWNE